MSDPALHDVVVLELATGVAGPYAGRLFRDLGAQVVKAEPLDGDPARSEPPLVGGESAFFAWLNAGKRSVALDDTPGALESLAAHADIVIHSARGAEARDLEARLIAAAPHAVVLSLAPYGQSGERADWATSELTEYATSGYHYFGGDPAREPLSLPGHQVEFHAGLHAGIAALTGLWHARSTGEGQRIEVSHQEAVLSDHAWLTTIWTHQGVVQRRTGSAFVRCADGFLLLFHLVPYPNLFVLIERFDLLEDETLLDPRTWWARFPEIRAAFGEWAATRTKQEVYHAAQELRIPVSPVNDMGDIATSPQLLARDWFGSVEAGGKAWLAPGVPYRLTGTPCVGSSSAAAPGADTAEVLAPGFVWANAASARGSTPAPTRLPLEGLRVIEMTAHWAGPIAGRHLADLGADAIKVELARKPSTRGLVWVADQQWPYHYHRSGYFNKLNRNKRDVCLDLATPEGKATFLRLVEQADVVIENNAARVMGNLGLDYERLAAVNPRLVMCSMTGFGATGPERNYSAFGSNTETLSGLASLLGYGPGEYFGSGSFYADPVTGGHAAVAILAALHARRTTGRGQWIDMSLLEAVAPFFAQPFLSYGVTGVVPEPRGNRSERYEPSAVYPSAGSDCWLALTVRDVQEWAALCRAIDRLDLFADPALATVEGRRSARETIDAAICGWSAALDHNEASRLLQAAGVPAAPVMANWEVFSDNDLNARDFFVRVAHPEAGTHWFPGFPWRFEKTPAVVRRHAPLFAQDNRAVFEGLLGMTAAEVDALYAAGITQDAPIYASGPGL